MNGSKTACFKGWLIKPIIFAALLILTGCQEHILHGLEEHDANKLVAQLHESAIEASKVQQADGKWALAVSRSESIKAIKLLSDARVFKGADKGGAQRTSLVSSKQDQRFQYERAVSRELERTLLGMPHVLDARVHLNLPVTDPIFGNRIPEAKGSGSVLLVVAESFSGNMSQIGELITGAAGLDKGSVSIIVSRETGEVPKLSEISEAPEAGDELKLDRIGPLLIQGSLILSVILALLYSFKLGRRRFAGRKARKFEEEDLYELARDFH